LWAAVADRQCGQERADSQQLTTSYALDRLPDLIAHADPEQLLLLARHLATDWAHYRSAMSTTLTCVNQAHRGENARSIPSLLALMLTDTQWLPARQQAKVVLRRPREVWRVAPDLPRRAQDWLPLLDPTLDRRAFLQAWTDLDVVDGARPQPADLTALLRSLAAEWEANGTQPEEVSVVPGLARSAMARSWRDVRVSRSSEPSTLARSAKVASSSEIACCSRPANRWAVPRSWRDARVSP
jgi:hypothetical protein